MTKNEDIKILIDQGYEGEDPTFYKKIEGANCLCNDKPPKINVTIYTYGDYLSMEMGIRGQTVNGEWVDLKYYSMKLDNIKRLSELEHTLVKMWECAN